MSNAVDIVMIGGPRSGRMVCMELPKLTAYIEFLGADVINPMIRYVVTKRQIVGVWYRFGIPEGSVEPTDAEILAAGAIPQWDLNRVQITP